MQIHKVSWLRRTLAGANRLQSHPDMKGSTDVWVVPHRRDVQMSAAKRDLVERLELCHVSEPEIRRHSCLLTCAEQFYGRVSLARDLNPGKNQALDLEKAIVVAQTVADIGEHEQPLVGQDRPVLISAALLHGLGWASPSIRRESFRTSRNRMIAMVEATVYAKFVLVMMGKTADYRSFFEQRGAEIVKLVGNYDNPSMEPPTLFAAADHKGLALREADRLYMMTEDGLQADLARKKGGMTTIPEILFYNARRILDERNLYLSRGDDIKGKLFITERARLLFDFYFQAAIRKHRISAKANLIGDS